jgi:hypothetical protein
MVVSLRSISVCATGRLPPSRREIIPVEAPSKIMVARAARRLRTRSLTASAAVEPRAATVRAPLIFVAVGAFARHVRATGISLAIRAAAGPYPICRSRSDHSSCRFAISRLGDRFRGRIGISLGHGYTPCSGLGPGECWRALPARRLMCCAV